ncbi:MAG TPA: FAD-dependent monooxygenase [Kofleriaceae bacterium]|nr:FAD-dependent monooxygenase [Kofleriaceae bacterium]
MGPIDPRLNNRYDVVVVGARVAGAATAMLIARAGLSVLVLDRGREGTDTLSTHALMRAGVLQLHHWGILEPVRRKGTPLVTSTSFHYGDEEIRVQLKPRDGIDGLYAPRRTVIDQLLVEGARAAGAVFVYGVSVTQVLRDDRGRVCGVAVKDVADHATAEVHANLVIGADGVRSTIANLVGATPTRTARTTTAVVFSYFSNLPIEGYHWYYRPKVSAGAIPTNDGVCVFAAMPPQRFEEQVASNIAAGHEQVLRECDASLADAVSRATRTDPYRGFPGTLGYFRKSSGPGWALVGDAGYFKDPLTAHGMTDAFVDAEHLARAVIAGTDDAVADYERARDERSAEFFELTDQIASFEWDLPTIQGLHRRLSDEMKQEAAIVLAMHGAR